MVYHDSDDSDRAPDAEALRLFVGGDSPAPADYYLKKWQGLRRGASGRAGMNWAAFIFGPVWCFYRRLFWFGGIVYALELMAGLLAGLALATQGETLDTGDSIPLVLIPGQLLVRAFVGIAANVVYYRRAGAVIRNSGDHARTPTERRRMIAAAGGVSYIGVAIAIAINLLQRVLVGA
jgi:hypothetical protein